LHDPLAIKIFDGDCDTTAEIDLLPIVTKYIALYNMILQWSILVVCCIIIKRLGTLTNSDRVFVVVYITQV